MFAQIVPLFQLSEKFSVLPVIYSAEYISGLQIYDLTTAPALGNPAAQGVIAIAALAANVIVLAAIIKRAKKNHINPYRKEVWAGTSDYAEAMERAE